MTEYSFFIELSH